MLVAAMTVCKVFAAIGGVLFLWAAILLKESEEGRVQRTLETWRDRLTTWPVTTQRRRNAVLGQCAAIASSLLDNLFGNRLVTIRAVCVAASLSLGAVFASETVFNVLHDEHITPTYLVLGPLLLACAFAPLVRMKFTVVPVLAVLCAPIATLAVVGQDALPMLVLALPVGVTGAFLLISVTRRVFRDATRTRSLGATLLLLTANLAVAVALVTPMFAGRAIGRASGDFIVEILWESAGNVLAASNLPAVVAASLVFVVAMLLLLDSSFWFLLERPVYAAARYGVLQKKKSLASIGVALITAATPSVGIALQGAAQHFLK